MPGLATSSFGGFGSNVSELQPPVATGERAASSPDIKLETPKLPQVMDEEEL